MALSGQYALRDVDRASFGARHENLKEDRRILYTDVQVVQHYSTEDKFGCACMLGNSTINLPDTMHAGQERSLNSPKYE